MCSDELQESVESDQVNVLSDAPFRVIPPPSAATSEVFPSARTIFLSSTDRVVELIVVVVPFTVRSPVTTRCLFTVTVLVADPIEITSAAPPKLIVVATVFKRLNDVLAVVI